MKHVTMVTIQHMSLCNHIVTPQVAPSLRPAAQPLPSPHLLQDTSGGPCPSPICEHYATQPITFHTKDLLSPPQHFLLFLCAVLTNHSSSYTNIYRPFLILCSQ